MQEYKKVFKRDLQGSFWWKEDFNFYLLEKVTVICINDIQLNVTHDSGVRVHNGVLAHNMMVQSPEGCNDVLTGDGRFHAGTGENTQERKATETNVKETENGKRKK